ncbi:transposase, partial [Candidatus Beckwithbacteria bacterium]|nr:transposase [Candidatus Beckwithbacteria bacterium]
MICFKSWFSRLSLFHSISDISGLTCALSQLYMVLAEIPYWLAKPITFSPFLTFSRISSLVFFGICFGICLCIFYYFKPNFCRICSYHNGDSPGCRFHKYLEEETKIDHIFIYPRSPKINAYIERFNRTIQEEFLERNDKI